MKETIRKLVAITEAVGSKEITNTDRYNTEMKKSLIDKIFFLDKIDAQLIIDFGCADGTLIKFMKLVFPEIEYVGYDISADMIETARKNLAGLDNITLISNIDDLKRKIQSSGKTTAIVFSSVLHEIYSYDPEGISSFWKDLIGLSPDYVVIRDMAVSKTADRASDKISVARVRQLFDAKLLDQFEEIWGSIDENISLTHFLLKYRYKENWDREVRENYLPVTIEQLMAHFPKQYVPDYFEHYTLPFIRNQAREDFGVELNERTHVKLIYRKQT